MVKARRVKGVDCGATVADNARRIIAMRLKELLSFAPYVDDPANVAELHDLRIAAKRLRYTLELFRFAFPRDLAGPIDEIKAIQAHIGAMHDAEVMIARVIEIANADALARAERLVEIATSVGRGTVAQRHQRLRAAMTNRATPRDEVAYYTLVAHRADDRDRAYAAFVAAWKQMEAADFAGRLRRCVGLASPLQPEPPVPSEPGDAPVAPDAVTAARGVERATA